MAMLTGTIKHRYFTDNGEPLAGGKVFTYEAGTSTPKATYKDRDGLEPNTNPVILDANGEADILLSSGSYKIVLKTSTDVERWTVDNIDSGSGSIDKSLLLNKGDLIIATGPGVATNLGVGLSGTVLTADPTEPTGAAWRTLSSLSATVPTGACLDFMGSTAPTGYVLASSKTIGNLSSGATERANDDTQSLFVLLWNSHANTELAIQDSSGSPTSRGASAIVDFNLGKRLPTPDLRGRVAVGMDNMGGSAANRMTTGGANIDGSVLGKSGGEQTHALTSGENGPHIHTQDAHAHTVVYDATGGTSTNNRVTRTSGATAVGNLVTDSLAPTIQSSGSGTAHNNTQPSWIVNKIIKL